MNIRTGSLGLGLLILAGCTAPAPSSSPSATPTALPTPTPIAAATACTPDRLAVAAGDMGSAAGTSYVTIRVELVGQEPCELVRWPTADVRGPDDLVIVTAPIDPSTAGQTQELTGSFDYYLGWSSWCGPGPVGPFTADIGLIPHGPPLRVPLPAGYGPSGCVGSSTILSLQPAS